MKFRVSNVQGNGFTEVAVTHGDVELTWSARAYSKVKLADPNRVFKELNEYLEQVDEATHTRMFQSYEEVHKLYRLGYDPSMLVASLVHHIGEINKHLPMGKLRRWLMTIGNLHIPADVQESITQDSRYNKREQTYLKADYINIATEALAAQALIPIWSEYMDQCTDQELYKENHVVGLVNETEMANWPMGETDLMGEEIQTVFDKLASYIKYCVDGEPLSLARGFAGMSSTDVRVLLQSKVLVRRLPLIPLNDPTSHSIVANIFRYVTTNMNPPERSTADRVAKKLPEGGGGDDEDKTSFIESHKTKGRISPGDIEAFNVDAMDFELLAEEVDPTICKEKLRQCISCVQQVASLEIRPHQILIAQWVMAKAFPARAFYHVSKLPVNYLLATSQALLWHWGFKDVAILMQVEPLRHGEHNSTNQLSQTRQGSRIANRFRPQLDELYPNMKLQKTPQNGSETPKPENMAGLAINSCNQSVRSSNWVYHGPDALYVEANQTMHNRVLMVPQTIKHTLTEVVIHLAQINQ
jgi:hypothetical protein